MFKFHKQLKNMDIFGHKVQLNFSNKRKTHTTLLGGIVSIIISASLLCLIVVRGITLLT